MTTTDLRLVVRYDTLAGAIASAKRLARKYDRNCFAIAWDDQGIPGFTYPFAVIAPEFVG